VRHELVEALRHQSQRHDMGLTIHYRRAITGDETPARKLVQQLRQAALVCAFTFRANRVLSSQSEQL
jgi:hypothetical protein